MKTKLTPLNRPKTIVWLVAISIFVLVLAASIAQAQTNSEALDKKVESFLQKHKGSWHNLNVPYEDGQTLFDIIVRHGYKSALEIGTSTGHSTVWLAWAMSKTGGKVTTLELDRGRHEEALKNIEEAGLSAYVNAINGNAHDLVKQLPGPFDFVFSDADKGWYTQYFKDVDPKLNSGGCFTTHNVIDGNSPEEYLDFVKANNAYITTIDRKSQAGIMISYKK
jgi:caffeoyl-CoA O-methyltransferase